MRAVFRLLVLLLLPVQVWAGVDLILNHTDAGFDPIAAGGTVTYTLSVENDGDAGATGVTTTHSVPASATYEGFTGMGVSCTGLTLGQAGPGTLSCSLPDLAPAAISNFSIDLKATIQDFYTFGAIVDSTEPDDTEANNTSNETTTVKSGADIAVSLTPSTSTAASGSAYTWALDLSNAGPDPAESLRVTVPVPAGFTVTSLPTACSDIGGTITCDISGPIANGASLSIGDITGVISAGSGSTITATAAVGLAPGASPLTPGDPNSSNNTSVANITVTAGTDMTISKSRSVTGSILIGDSFDFTISPSYSGDSPTTITVTDTVPANYTIGVVASPQNGWTCGVAGQLVSCIKASGGASGFNQSLGDIVISVTVNSSGANITNTTSISAAGPTDSNLSNNTATDGGVVLENPVVRLGLTKSGPVPNLVVVGMPFQFSFQTSNTGTTDFIGDMEITDTVPANMTVNSYAELNGWACTPATPVAAGATITCSRTYSAPGLAPSTAAPIIVFDAEVSVPGSFTNTATVTPTSCTGLIIPATCSGSTTSYNGTGSTAGNSADIQLIKNVSAAVIPSPAGDVVTYTLEVVNAGPNTSNTVVLTDTFNTLISNGVAPTAEGYISEVLVSGLATGANCSNVAAGSAGRALTCNFATIPVCVDGTGNCPVVTIQVRPGGDGGVRPNSANAVSNGTADPDRDNDTDTADITIAARADITAIKTVSPASVPAGQDLTYVIATPNNGPSRADNVIITDTLPLDVTFVSATPSTGVCGTTPGANVVTTGANRTLVCDLGNINNAAQQTVTVIVNPTTTTRGTTITNNVSVETTTTEVPGGAANNAATVDATVTNPSLDLVLNKDDSIDPVAVGDDTVYTVRVTNSGPSIAELVEITDVLPIAGSGLSFQSVAASQGACGTAPAPNAVGGTLICQIGTLAAGDSETISVTMQGTVKGFFDNNASVTSTESLAGFDVLLANNAVSEDTTVRSKADMQVLGKVASASPVNLRENFNFVISVINNVGAGLAEADDVVVSDNLPAGMELTGNPTAVITGTTTLNSCTGIATNTSFSCSFGTVNNGTTMQITVPVQLVAAVTNPQTFTNTATVATSSLDTDPSNDSQLGTVDVDSSSIAGRVFRDFDNNGAFNGTDSGVGGIIITLTGTAFDGGVISTTVTTMADGTYTFESVPAGTYTITEGAIPASEHLVDGIDTDGSLGGGNIGVNDQISNIVLPTGTAATGYLFAEIPVPLIGAAKSAGAVADEGDGTFSVPFTFTINNAGGTPLDSIQVLDDLTVGYGAYVGVGVPGVGQYTLTAPPVIINAVNNAAFTVNAAFDGSGDQNLLVAATSSLPDFGANPSSAQITITIRFYPPALDLGPFNNTAIANGIWPLTSDPVTDDSVEGLDTDPTNNDDPTDDASPTVINVFGQEIGVAKEVSGSIIQTGARRFAVPYSLIVSNVAQVATATNVQVIDDLSTTFPTAQSIALSVPATVSACTGTVLTAAAPVFTGTGQNNLLVGDEVLLVGESCTITFTVVVDYGSNALPSAIQNNQAQATTSANNGDLIATDLSDDGTVPDSNSNNVATDAGENDPTPVNFIPAGGLASVSGKVWLDINHDRNDNDGPTSPISDFIVEVINASGDIVGTATTATDGTYTVSNLLPSTSGDPATEYSVRFRDPVSMTLYGFPVTEDPAPARNGTINNGVITGLQLAAGVNTLNQSLPLDPSGVVYDSITRAPIAGATVTLLSGGVAVPDACLIGGGNVQVVGASGFYQYLLINPAPGGCPGDATYTLQVAPPGGYLPPESISIPVTPGPYVPTNGGVDTIQTQAGPPTGGQPTTYYFDFDLRLGISSAVVNNHIPLDPILGGAIIVTKTTLKKDVVRGELVPYTVTVRNTLASTLTDIALQDQTPAGFKYIEGSSTVNGVKLEPTITGRSLTWSPLTFAPTGDTAGGDIKTFQMILIIGSGVSEGQYVNQAWAENILGNTRVSNIAAATVRLIPDPLFDCSDLIGKVFDDKNINGYQDEGEPGLAGVSVVTPRGLLVTTDAYGRFHIACADVPNELHGSNFIMKLDERTLPSGYRVTTENPRVVRLTRGKLVKLNFGAGLHRILRVDIDRTAFNPEGDKLSVVADEQLLELFEILKQQPSQVRLSYATQAREEKGDARQRMQVFADALKQLWQQCDCEHYALTIEREVFTRAEASKVKSAIKGAK